MVATGIFLCSPGGDGWVRVKLVVTSPSWKANWMSPLPEYVKSTFIVARETAYCNSAVAGCTAWSKSEEDPSRPIQADEELLEVAIEAAKAADVDDEAGQQLQFGLPVEQI